MDPHSAPRHLSVSLIPSPTIGLGQLGAGTQRLAVMRTSQRPEVDVKTIPISPSDLGLVREHMLAVSQRDTDSVYNSEAYSGP